MFALLARNLNLTHQSKSLQLILSSYNKNSLCNNFSTKRFLSNRFSPSTPGIKNNHILRPQNYVLLVRRTRFGRGKKVDKEEIKNVKVTKSSLKRLLELAAPEKYKIAGKIFKI
jgi:hypothetical protein